MYLAYSPNLEDVNGCDCFLHQHTPRTLSYYLNATTRGHSRARHGIRKLVPGLLLRQHRTIRVLNQAPVPRERDDSAYRPP